MDKKINHLIEIFEMHTQDETEIINQKISDEKEAYFYIPNLESINSVFALHDIYIEKDFLKAKQHFFLAARIAEYISNKYDVRIIDSGINQISYALLSDNMDLIGRYRSLKNTINNELSIGFQLPNAVQSILLNNWDKLSDNIHNLERFVAVPHFKCWAPTIEVLEGFLNKNKVQIENGLVAMIQTHKKRNTSPLISKFFSVDTAGFCKLAWMQGYEIDLKSTLVPFELMPIKPLTEYEEYEFLN